MSKFLSHITSLLLISVLAFSQVGLNFFHTEHLEHSSIIKALYELPPKGDVVQQHNEHCKVCSVDFFGKLYIKPSGLVLPFIFQKEQKAIFITNAPKTVSILKPDRGPPTSVFL